jgi:hypothetical protein
MDAQLNAAGDESLLEVNAVDVPEGKAISGEDLGLQIGFVREEAGAIVAVDRERGGDCGEGLEVRGETPVVKEEGAVGG